MVKPLKMLTHLYCSKKYIRSQFRFQTNVSSGLLIWMLLFLSQIQVNCSHSSCLFKEFTVLCYKGDNNLWNVLPFTSNIISTYLYPMCNIMNNISFDAKEMDSTQKIEVMTCKSRIIFPTNWILESPQSPYCTKLASQGDFFTMQDKTWNLVSLCIQLKEDSTESTKGSKNVRECEVR